MINIFKMDRVEEIRKLSSKINAKTDYCCEYSEVNNRLVIKISKPNFRFELSTGLENQEGLQNIIDHTKEFFTTHYIIQ